MTLIDFAKAVGVAIAILILNIFVAILVVLLYRFAVEPGHPSEFYDQAALRIAPWCSHIAGTGIFFGAGYLCARRKPQRNGFAFAAACAAAYAIIDAAMVGFVGAFEVKFVLSILAKLLAGLSGAFLANRTRTQPA